MTLDGNIFSSNAKQRHGNSAETFRPRFAIISQERFPGKAACDVGIFAAFITIIDDLRAVQTPIVTFCPEAHTAI